MKLSDFVKLKVNSRNKQNSLDVQKLKLKEAGISVNDLLEIKFKKLKKFDEI